MDAKELLAERKALFTDTMNFRPTKRIPTSSNISYWHIFDCGYSLEEGLYHADDAYEKMQDEFFQRYNFDAYMNVPGTTFHDVSRIFGEKNFQIDKSGNTMVYHDQPMLERDEVAAYVQDSTKVLWTNYLPRKYGAQIPMAKFEDSIQAFMRMGVRSAAAFRRVNEKYGALTNWEASASFMPPIETYVSSLRGIKEGAIDLRRCKDTVRELFDMMFQQSFETLKKNALAAKDLNTCVAPLQVPMMAHSILNRKQFEEFYWAYLKPVIDFAVENKIPMYFYVEAEILRFAEYFQDIPKGLAIMQHEQDDIFELRKALPNMALCGGMPLDLLGTGTKEQCEDYAKKLIDGLGGGFVMGQDKMGLCRDDIRRENLLAVQEVARTYA